MEGLRSSPLLNAIQFFINGYETIKIDLARLGIDCAATLPACDTFWSVTASMVDVHSNQYLVDGYERTCLHSHEAKCEIAKAICDNKTRGAHNNIAFLLFLLNVIEATRKCLLRICRQFSTDQVEN